MTPFLRKLLGQNWLLLLTTLGLAVFGVVAIYSATSTRADSYAADFWRKQANWVAVGVFAFMLTSLVHYRWIRWGALPMYLAGIVFLILTKFIGTKVYGARSWLHVGPINFQPAQLAVVAIPYSVSRDAPHAAVVTVWCDCRGAVPAHSAATRFGRGYHLDSGAPGALVCRRTAVTLFDLHHSRRNRFYLDRD